MGRNPLLVGADSRKGLDLSRILYPIAALSGDTFIPFDTAKSETVDLALV
jgi:hypothetical protein